MGSYNIFLDSLPFFKGRFNGDDFEPLLLTLIFAFHRARIAGVTAMMEFKIEGEGSAYKLMRLSFKLIADGRMPLTHELLLHCAIDMMQSERKLTDKEVLQLEIVKVSCLEFQKRNLDCLVDIIAAFGSQYIMPGTAGMALSDLILPLLPKTEDDISFKTFLMEGSHEENS